MYFHNMHLPEEYFGTAPGFKCWVF